MIARVLPPSEWDRLAVTGNPPFDHVRPEDIAVVAVESDGAIIASVAVMRLPHFEALWIAPEHRGNAGAFRLLIKTAFKTARQWADTWIMAGSASPVMDSMLERLGGKKVPMSVHILPVREV